MAGKVEDDDGDLVSVAAHELSAEMNQCHGIILAHPARSRLQAQPVETGRERK
ncbi:hypothetical protein GCM10017710_42430 [Arthrobacter ramosus]